jgi:hypothetical protein
MEQHLSFKSKQHNNNIYLLQQPQRIIDMDQQLSQLTSEQRQAVLMQAQQEANQRIMQDMLQRMVKTCFTKCAGTSVRYTTTLQLRQITLHYIALHCIALCCELKQQQAYYMLFSTNKLATLHSPTFFWYTFTHLYILAYVKINRETDWIAESSRAWRRARISIWKRVPRCNRLWNNGNREIKNRMVLFISAGEEQ